jgi:hypothetical protein
MCYVVKKKSADPYEAEKLFVFEDVRKFEKWLSENTNLSEGHIEDLLEELSQSGLSVVYADYDYLTIIDHEKKQPADAFHQHLDACAQCREHPMELCQEGSKLLISGATGEEDYFGS